MNDTDKTNLIVASLIRRGDEVLLVRLREPANQPPSLVLPAGDVTPRELLLETLVRRVREETGLVVQDVGCLLYTMHLDNSNNQQLVGWVFDVEVWSGEVRPDDPDGSVAEARFFPLSEAVAKLQGLPQPRGGPIVAHLRGEAGPGAMWLYRGHADGTYECVTRLDGGSVDQTPVTSAL